MRKNMKKTVLALKHCATGGIAVLFLLFFAAVVSAQEAKTWQNEITLYGWYSGIDGTLQLSSGVGTDVEFEASDILDNLNMIFMGGYTGKYDRWSILVDVVYLDVSKSNTTSLASGKASVNLGLKAWVVSAGVGYDMIQSDRATLAAIGGARYLRFEEDVQLELLGYPITEESGSQSLVDGIIGLKGRIMLTDNWYLPYYGDIGAGGSDFTWQLFGGVGYRFSWGDIRLGYRHLEYDLDDKRLMKDLGISGPILGIGFRF